MKAIKVGKHYFKYDFEKCIVSMYSKIKGEELEGMIEDNREWQKKYHEDLFEIVDGDLLYLESAGLRRENWNNREARREYLTEMEFDFEEETAYLMYEAI